MKKIVVYSSKTGNTKKIGEAIADELGCKAVSFDVAKDIDFNMYDFIAVGFYVDKGAPEINFKKFMQERIKDKNVGLFITLGSDDDGDHAKQILNVGRELLIANNNKILREFVCQGAISDEVLEQMRKLGEMMPNDPRFALTPERLARWERGKSHPDDDDVENAKLAFSNL